MVATGRREAFQAPGDHLRDDFVILSRGYAQQARDWTRQVMSRIGLILNEAKTSVRRARQERFDFLGYTFGPYCYRKDGHWYLGTGPSKKSIARVRQRDADLYWYYAFWKQAGLFDERYGSDYNWNLNCIPVLFLDRTG
jgi:RNA-directed DNA polymerase